MEVLPARTLNKTLRSSRTGSLNHSAMFIIIGMGFERFEDPLRCHRQGSMSYDRMERPFKEYTRATKHLNIIVTKKHDRNPARQKPL
jgi:hypothetical protein